MLVDGDAPRAPRRESERAGAALAVFWRWRIKSGAATRLKVAETARRRSREAHVCESSAADQPAACARRAHTPITVCSVLCGLCAGAPRTRLDRLSLPNWADPTDRPSSELLGRKVNYNFAQVLDTRDTHSTHPCFLCVLTSPLHANNITNGPCTAGPCRRTFASGRRRGGGGERGEGAGLMRLRRTSSRRPSACPCTCILGGPRRRCTARRQQTPLAPSPRTA